LCARDQDRFSRRPIRADEKNDGELTINKSLKEPFFDALPAKKSGLQEKSCNPGLGLLRQSGSCALSVCVGSKISHYAFTRLGTGITAFLADFLKRRKKLWLKFRFPR
jgi:hypothetical protein